MTAHSGASFSLSPVKPQPERHPPCAPSSSPTTWPSHTVTSTFSLSRSWRSGNSWARPLEQTWYVRTDAREDQIEAQLRGHLDPDDGLLIQATRDEAVLTNTALRWFRQRRAGIEAGGDTNVIAFPMPCPVRRRPTGTPVASSRSLLSSLSPVMRKSVRGPIRRSGPVCFWAGQVCMGQAFSISRAAAPRHVKERGAAGRRTPRSWFVFLSDVGRPQQDYGHTRGVSGGSLAPAGSATFEPATVPDGPTTGPPTQTTTYPVLPDWRGAAAYCEEAGIGLAGRRN